MLVLVLGVARAAWAGAVLAGALALLLAPDVVDGAPGARGAGALLAAALAWPWPRACSSPRDARGCAFGWPRSPGAVAGSCTTRSPRPTRSAAAVRAAAQRGAAGADDRRQDLDQAIAGDPQARASAAAALALGIDQLRDSVAELHPPALEHGGLQPAVTAVLERACRDEGLVATSRVDPAADGLRDELVVALIRELVVNVAKHAYARHVEVVVARTATGWSSRSPTTAWGPRATGWPARSPQATSAWPRPGSA
jgi:hypothetical protein